MIRQLPCSTRSDTHFPYTTRFRSADRVHPRIHRHRQAGPDQDRSGCTAKDNAHCGGGDNNHRTERRQCQRGKTRPSSQRRSEEHTSELQSLMRNSYAVFCLKKKNIKIKKTTTKTNNDTIRV